MLTDTAISVRSLHKHFGETRAVDGIDLDVGKGEIFGFLGANGAGKSTTINVLCTLMSATSGSARVAGYDTEKERDEVRRNIGLVFQESVLDGYLTVEQNLRFHGGLFGIPRNLLVRRIDETLEATGITDRRHDVVMDLSGGLKRRLEIARGLLHSPSLLFLDEPTAGLDPLSRQNIWEYVRGLREARGITVFMTTHYLEEAEYCDRIAIIDRGRIVALDRPERLKSEIGRDRVTLRTRQPEVLVSELAEGFGTAATVRGEDTVEFLVSEGASFVPRLLSRTSADVDSVEVTQPSLDDVFLSHTTER